MGRFAFFLLFFAIFGLAIAPHWKILTRTGRPGPISLLMLVPGVHLVLVYWLAWGAWHCDDEDQA